MDAASPPSTPPAAWYADPHNPANVRYWDGTAWTAQVAPAVAPQPAPAPAWPAASPATGQGPGDALHWLVPVGRSGESIAAGYMGLACLVLFWTGPIVVVLAIVTVWISLRALQKANTGGHGTGRAITGIVTAVIGAVAGIAFTAAWFF